MPDVETKTPRELLEKDVIYISEPGLRKIVIKLPDGTDYPFGIIPLSFHDLERGEDQIRKIINEFKLLSQNIDDFREPFLKIVSVNRSVETEGAGKPAPSDKSANDLWDNMVKTLFNPNVSIEMKNRAENIFKSIILLGSEADYEKVRNFSIWTIIRIVKEIINHNYTDRLRDFYLGEPQ